MSNWWRHVMTSKRWSNAGLAFLAVLTIALIAANMIQNRSREEAVLAGMSTTTSTATATTQAAPPVALFFGDSYFNGSSGVSASETMAHRAGMTIGYLPHIAGYGGTGFVGAQRVEPFTPNYLGQLEAGALTEFDPAAVRLVVVEGGLNDLTHPADEITHNASAILAKMGQTFPKAKMVLLGPVATTGTPSSLQKNVVAALTEAAKTANVPFIDATEWITPDNVGSVIGPDKVHPTMDGHKALGDQLANALRDLDLSAS